MSSMNNMSKTPGVCSHRRWQSSLSILHCMTQSTLVPSSLAGKWLAFGIWIKTSWWFMFLLEKAVGKSSHVPVNMSSKMSIEDRVVTHVCPLSGCSPLATAGTVSFNTALNSLEGAFFGSSFDLRFETCKCHQKMCEVKSSAPQYARWLQMSYEDPLQNNKPYLAEAKEFLIFCGPRLAWRISSNNHPCWAGILLMFPFFKNETAWAAPGHRKEINGTDLWVACPWCEHGKLQMSSASTLQRRLHGSGIYKVWLNGLRWGLAMLDDVDL